MDTSDLFAYRREALKRLLSTRFAGSQADLARVLSRQPAQVNQWIKGRRSITDESRDLIETRCNLPPGWLDQFAAPAATAASTLPLPAPATPNLIASLPVVLDALRAVPPTRQALLLDRLTMWVRHGEEADRAALEQLLTRGADGSELDRSAA